MRPPPAVTQHLRVSLTSHGAAAGDLPEHQANGVDVGSLERLKVFHVYGVVQDLWCHIPNRKGGKGAGLLGGMTESINLPLI